MDIVTLFPHCELTRLCDGGKELCVHLVGNKLNASEQLFETVTVTLRRKARKGYSKCFRLNESSLYRKSYRLPAQPTQADTGPIGAAQAPLKSDSFLSK